MSTAYRLVELGGKLANFKAEMLEALCDVLEMQPGESFERGTPPRGRARASKRAR